MASLPWAAANAIVHFIPEDVFHPFSPSWSSHETIACCVTRLRLYAARLLGYETLSLSQFRPSILCSPTTAAITIPVPPLSLLLSPIRSLSQDCFCSCKAGYYDKLPVDTTKPLDAKECLIIRGVENQCNWDVLLPLRREQELTSFLPYVIQAKMKAKYDSHTGKKTKAKLSIPDINAMAAKCLEHFGKSAVYEVHSVLMEPECAYR